jgi:hypothetical protein
MRPVAFEPARILPPDDNGTSCIRRAVTISPVLLFVELSDEFKRNGNIVPGGIALCPNNPVVNISRLARSAVFMDRIPPQVFTLPPPFLVSSIPYLLAIDAILSPG